MNYEIDEDYVRDYTKEFLNHEENKHFVLEGKSIPLSSITRGGPPSLRPKCLCTNLTKHISFFDALQEENKDKISMFCNNVDSFLVGRLPCWLTRLKNKKQFTELPTVFNVFSVFEKTFWFKFYIKENHKFEISRELRLLLIASTGRELSSFGKIGTRELLCLRTDPSALHRIKNFFITLDGLLISLLLSSQGDKNICNWKFFEKVMKTYIDHAVFDLFLMGDKLTYYEKLKKSRGLMKDLLLKERSGIVKNKKMLFDSNFWFFDYVILSRGLRRVYQTPSSVTSLSYLVQTRSAGLPPEPLRIRATKKFIETVSKVPKHLSSVQKTELIFATRSVLREIRNPEGFENLFDYALSSTKVSLTDSASFRIPRGEGGKFEEARLMLSYMKGLKIPVLDLNTGKVKYTVNGGDGSLKPGQELLMASIATAINHLSRKTTDEVDHIGDVRFASVEEPGKSRIITIPMIEHSIILHPLAHILSDLLSSIESTRSGLKKTNHLWDFYTRIKRDSLVYKIYKSKFSEGTLGLIPDEVERASIFLGSEDWTSATDSMNPHAVKLMLECLTDIAIPRFYLGLCIKLITMPRRVYSSRRNHPQNPTSIKFSGILQGDPLCKQILHMSHLVSRFVALRRLEYIGLVSMIPPFKEKNGDYFGCVPKFREMLKTAKEQAGNDREKYKYLVTARFNASLHRMYYPGSDPLPQQNMLIHGYFKDAEKPTEQDLQDYFKFNVLSINR